MSIASRITNTALNRHRWVTRGVLVATLLVALLAALPSLPGDWPVIRQLQPLLAGLHTVEVDTDPENMLAEDEPVRLFHDRMKERLDLHDMIVVGVVNEEHPAGVFNPDSLARIDELTRFAKTLRGEEIGVEDGAGVAPKDVISLSTVDNLQPISGGIRFSWLMRTPPQTQGKAEQIRADARRIPFLHDTVVSADGQAAAIYVPITRKDLSYRVSRRLQEKIESFDGADEFHITGLPVAEDTFGVEMFIQMAISAPAAMLVIFLLMLVFFRKLVIIVSPMLVALVCVILTMGALVIAGYPIHIMSSMIPIFIMPIAVLDSIHIISEFFEKYQATGDRKRTMREVMDALFAPMLYTSLTSAAGFASLALTPIPPVQVFGVFVALGILAAWALTVTFIPAFVMWIPERMLAGFGAKHEAGERTHESLLTRFLHRIAGGTYRRAKPILAAAGVVLVVAAWGISRININDNPVKWFTPSHPIREADRVLNRHFGGTYMAYLAMEAEDRPYDADAAGRAVIDAAEGDDGLDPVREELTALARDAADAAEGWDEFYARLDATIDGKTAPAAPPGPQGDAEPAGGGPALPAGMGDGPALPAGMGAESAEPGDADAPATAPSRALRRAWDAADLLVDRLNRRRDVFKDPEVLAYQARLQQAMAETGVVGKSNSLADIVKTVRRDFVSGEREDFRIPETADGVAQMLLQFQQSHRKDDLWHFVTPDYRTSSVWIQLTSGDNRDMSRVVAAVDEFIAENPPPAKLTAEPTWFGLTYINVVWQEKMVTGMLEAFAGSFLVVLVLMTILFRSPLWGLLSMIPLTVTIVAIYGAIGIIGKDYDMPIAVLSSLTLGLAVDFAIHFLARAREMYRRYGSWRETVGEVFGEPARAIARNIIVIAAGFLPLLLAPLMPYKTVGIFLATILLVSGIATLLILPAMIRVLEGRLFAEKRTLRPACNCALCVISSVLIVAVVALNLYGSFGWSTTTWLSAAAVVLLGLACGALGRRATCRREKESRRNAEAQQTPSADSSDSNDNPGALRAQDREHLEV